ncbi:MAG: hypothetical protein J7647_27870 [Cyanobacteria bacterium SBLK]|nr:hypothetical protein [Cyanobacteria bacterium SBLK]
MASKRINLTVPEHLHADLEHWANTQGRATANLAAFLIERTVADAKRTGEFPTNESDKMASQFLRTLFSGGYPQNGEIVRLAHRLGVSEEFLLDIRDRYLEGRSR